MDVLLNRAVKEVGKLRSGEVFLVKDLFVGYEWNRLSKGDRLLLGSMFLTYVRTNGSGIDIVPRGTSGQQKYRKK